MLLYVRVGYIALYETNEELGYLGLVVKACVGDDAQQKLIWIGKLSL